MNNLYLQGIIANFSSKKHETFCQFIDNDVVRNITWAMLESSSANFLSKYINVGVPKGGTILIFLRHSEALYGSFVGAMFGGFVPSFMPCLSHKQNPELYWKSHLELFNVIKPSAIVADAATIKDLNLFGLSEQVQLINIDEPFIESRLLQENLNLPEQASVALLQHSSGTTGLKKGVQLSYAAIHSQIESYGDAIELSQGDIIASWLPLYHDMGFITGFIMPLFYGVTTVQISPLEWVSRPQLLFQYIEQFNATLCWLPNFAFEHLANSVPRLKNRYELNSVRAFISCSEMTSASTFDRFREIFRSYGLRPSALQVCYAMAEAVFAVTQTPLNSTPQVLYLNRATLNTGDMIDAKSLPSASHQKMVLSVGQPIAGVSLGVYSDGGSILNEGIVGEVGIAADFLFSGYNQLPELTKNKLRNQVYHSGDLGFILNGSLYLLGRIDDLIIVNGRNLYASEIEQVLIDIPGIKPGRSIAFGHYDDRVGSQVLIIICEFIGNELEPVKGQIMRLIFSIFNATAREIHFVGEGWLIKTTSGKISRKENYRKYLDSISSK